MRRKIFIVEDHPIMREGYLSLINREPDLASCGTAADGLEALALITEAKPDLVVADLSMPGMNGLELIKSVQAQQPKLPFLVVSAHDESLYAERAVRAGARGYIMKHEAADVIITAIREVLAGRLFLSEHLRERIALRYLGQLDPADDDPLAALSDRELEVFRLIGQGQTTQEIADAMIISPKTVDTYRANIKKKLALDSTAELIQRAALWVASLPE